MEIFTQIILNNVILIEFYLIREIMQKKKANKVTARNPETFSSALSNKKGISGTNGIWAKGLKGVGGQFHYHL